MRAPDTKTYSAFSPCQITGFFRIHESSDPEGKGSTGAGINLDQGVTTRVVVRKAARSSVSVDLNGRPLARPLVSKRIANEYLEMADGNWRVQVDHQCGFPIGAGYGTSGAGAASLSLALNQAFGTNLSRLDALKIAHVADLESKTGLGTVASVSVGGLAVRTRPGAPGIGMVRKIGVRPSIRIVSGTFGPLSKAKILSSRTLSTRVNICARGLVEALLRRSEPAFFLNLSRRFADCLGLESSRLRSLLEILDRRGVVASMMMLGDGAFCIVPQRMAKGVAGFLRGSGMSAVINRVGTQGVHVL